MPPVPKKKHTKARTGKRRGKLKVVLPFVTVCKNCGAKKLPHRKCLQCQ